MANSTLRSDQAVANIINSVRNATRTERQNTLFRETRNSFRSSRNESRGRRSASTWSKKIFLLRRSNPDFYPCQSECSYLQQHGLGRLNGKISRVWSINRLQRYIIQSYPQYPLEDAGFRFAKCGRDKKILFVDFSNINELETSIGRGTLIIVPNRDLEIRAQSVDGIDADQPASTQAPTYSRIQERTSLNNTRYEISDDSDFELPSHAQTPTSDRSSAIRLARTSRTENEEGVEEDYDDASNLEEITEENYVLPPNMEFINILDDTLEVTTLEISRDTIMPQMLQLYKDEQLILKSIKVVFKGEVGLDYGGLTKELFTKFWKECKQEYFRGEVASVPYLSLSKIRKGLGEDFIIIGRILAHTLLLTKTLPSQFAKSFYLLLGDMERKVPETALDEDFKLFLTPVEKRLINKALTAFTSLSVIENDMLIELFQTYGLLELPSRTEIEQQIRTIAENVLCKEPFECVKKIKNGIPLVFEQFFMSLTYENLTAFYKVQAPTAPKLIDCLETCPEILSNTQSKIFYFFKTFIRNLIPADLCKLLLFITASEQMPEKVIVSFKNFGFPVAHSCSNTLELPNTYTSYNELSEILYSIIQNESCYEYNIL